MLILYEPLRSAGIERADELSKGSRLGFTYILRDGAVPADCYSCTEISNDPFQSTLLFSSSTHYFLLRVESGGRSLVRLRQDDVVFSRDYIMTTGGRR